MLEQIDFLRSKGPRDPMIDNWLVVAPQVKKPRGWHEMLDLQFAGVFRTRRDENRERFSTYNDPKHRHFALHLSSNMVLEGPNDELIALTRPRQGVLLLYFVTDDQKSEIVQGPFSPGFTLLFPKNNIITPITFKVRRKDLADAIVIESAPQTR